MKSSRIVTMLALAGLVGCGDDESSIKLVKVMGTVTKNGKPLADARISFVPEAGNKFSTPGVDTSGPEGNYMVSFKGRTGVSAGKYKVTVTPAIELPPGVKVPDAFKDDPMMMKIAQEARRGADKKYDAAEAKKEVKGEFNAEVPDEASVVRDFDIKAAASAGAPAKQ